MRVLTLTLAVLGAMLAPAAAQAQQGGDTVIGIRSDDQSMNDAIAKGRQTLPDFWKHYASPGRGEGGFVIKYDLTQGTGEIEYIWAEVISRAPGVTIGRIANVPRDTRFKLGEKVSVRDADIIDWGYYKDGVMQGHFTTRVLLPHLDPAQADAIRKAYNW